MIDKLPTELKMMLLAMSPVLRFVNREMLVLSNLTYKLTLQKWIPPQLLDKIHQLLKIFSSSFDFWHGALQAVFAPDLDWELVYRTFKNRKVFFKASDFVIQDNSEFVIFQDSLVELQKVHSFHYHKVIFLPNGEYNFQIALRNKESSRGLGTTRFQLRYLDEQFSNFPPTFINEMLPPGKLSVMNMGKFTINNSASDELTRVDIIMEEVGMYPKVDLSFDYLDFTRSKDDFLFYTIDGNPYEEYYKFVNPIEKTCHLAFDALLRRTMDLANTDSLINSYNLKFQSQDINDLKTSTELFYTNGTRTVKMRNANEQRRFQDSRAKPLKWRFPR